MEGYGEGVVVFGVDEAGFAAFFLSGLGLADEPADLTGVDSDTPVDPVLPSPRYPSGCLGVLKGYAGSLPSGSNFGGGIKL